MSCQADETLLSTLKSTIKNLNINYESLQKRVIQKNQKLDNQNDDFKKNLSQAQNLLSHYQSQLDKFSNNQIVLSENESLNSIKENIERDGKKIQELLNYSKEEFHNKLYSALNVMVEKLNTLRHKLKVSVHNKKERLGEKNYKDLKMHLSDSKKILIESSLHCVEFCERSTQLPKEVLLDTLETQIGNNEIKILEHLNKVEDQLKKLNRFSLGKQRLRLQKSMSHKSARMMHLFKFQSKEVGDIAQEIQTISRRMRSLSDKGSNSKDIKKSSQSLNFSSQKLEFLKMQKRDDKKSPDKKP